MRNKDKSTAWLLHVPHVVIVGRDSSVGTATR